MYDYSDYHLMSHRHGRDSIDWSLLGLLLVALGGCGGLALVVFFVFQSAACPQTMHNGRPVCRTTGPNNTIVYVPWGIWTYGGTYQGVSYSSGGRGSYSSYGSDDGSGGSDTGSSDDGGDGGGGD